MITNADAAHATASPLGASVRLLAYLIMRWLRAGRIESAFEGNREMR